MSYRSMTSRFPRFAFRLLNWFVASRLLFRMEKHWRAGLRPSATKKLKSLQKNLKTRTRRRKPCTRSKFLKNIWRLWREKGNWRYYARGTSRKEIENHCIWWFKSKSVFFSVFTSNISSQNFAWLGLVFLYTWHQVHLFFYLLKAQLYL